MKSKSVYLIALIAIVLVVIVFISEKPLRQDTAKTTTPRTLTGIKREAVFENVSADDCHRIGISKFDGRSTATLTKVDDIWYVNPERKYPASRRNIDRIFDTLKKTKEGEVISRNPKNHAKFQVDKMTGTRVKFFGKDDKLLADVYVGKMGMNYMSPTTYVRKASSDEVISVNGYMMYLFQTGQDSWRERTIFDIKPGKIIAFTIKQPGQPAIKLGRLASDDWTCLEPKTFKIARESGTRMVNSFARLSASSFIKDYPQKPYKDYGLGKDAYTISASLKDYSSTPTLYIGKESTLPRNQWYVRAEGQDAVYLIYKYNHDSLAKTLAEIEATPTPTPSPKPSLKKRVQEQAKKRKEAISKMTEKEKKAAAEKKLEEILKNARKRKKALKRDKLTPPPAEKMKKAPQASPRISPRGKTIAAPETSYGEK